MKKYLSFLAENFQFLVVKFSTHLNRRVFVMFIAERYLPVRVADGPITARYWFIKNANWDVRVDSLYDYIRLIYLIDCVGV